MNVSHTFILNKLKILNKKKIYMNFKGAYSTFNLLTVQDAEASKLYEGSGKRLKEEN